MKKRIMTIFRPKPEGKNVFAVIRVSGSLPLPLAPSVDEDCLFTVLDKSSKDKDQPISIDIYDNIRNRKILYTLSKIPLEKNYRVSIFDVRYIQINKRIIVKNTENEKTRRSRYSTLDVVADNRTFRFPMLSRLESLISGWEGSTFYFKLRDARIQIEGQSGRLNSKGLRISERTINKVEKSGFDPYIKMILNSSDEKSRNVSDVGC